MSLLALAGYPKNALHQVVIKAQVYGSEYTKSFTASPRRQLRNSNGSIFMKHTGPAEAIACAKT